MNEEVGRLESSILRFKREGMTAALRLATIASIVQDSVRQPTNIR